MLLCIQWQGGRRGHHYCQHISGYRQFIVCSWLLEANTSWFSNRAKKEWWAMATICKELNRKRFHAMILTWTKGGAEWTNSNEATTNNPKGNKYTSKYVMMRIASTIQNAGKKKNQHKCIKKSIWIFSACAKYLFDSTNVHTSPCNDYILLNAILYFVCVCFIWISRRIRSYFSVAIWFSFPCLCYYTLWLMGCGKYVKTKFFEQQPTMDERNEGYIDSKFYFHAIFLLSQHI